MTTRFTQFKLVGPALILIAILIMGLATIPYYGMERLDADVRERQETLVKRNISIWIEDVEFALTAWTIWDESIAKIDNAFDFEWTDRNIGRSLIGTSRTRFASILDADGKMIYSRTAEEVQERPFFARGAEAIGKDAQSLVENIRARENSVTTDGIPAPIALSKIEVIGTDAVLLTASLFQPDFKTAIPRGKTAPILVSATPIAGSLQEFVGTRFLLDDAVIGPMDLVPSGHARVEIAVGLNGQSEVLSWHPPTPARDLMRQSLPLISAVIIVLVAGGVFVARLSQRAAVSLVTAEQNMRHAATHDFLTGLPNRAMLESEFKRLAGPGDLVVACVDLDGFKGVNDRHGHAAGDELLKQVAERLQANGRENDVAFRLGGDEFVIFMPASSLEGAEWLCRKLSSHLSEPYIIQGAEVVVDASFGLSDIHINVANTCDQALKQADTALYAAKARGRGTVVTFSSLTQSETPRSLLAAYA